MVVRKKKRHFMKNYLGNIEDFINCPLQKMLVVIITNQCCCRFLFLICIGKTKKGSKAKRKDVFSLSGAFH